MSSIYRNGQFYGQTSNPINDAETSLTQTWSSEFISKFVGDNVDAIVEEIDSLEYSGLAPEVQNNGTVYFITDRGVIYHNGIEYGEKIRDYNSLNNIPLSIEDGEVKVSDNYMSFFESIGIEAKEMTSEEYNNLLPEEKEDEGIIYFINDGQLSSVRIIYYKNLPYGGGTGNADLSMYYTKEETEEVIDNKIENKVDKIEGYSLVADSEITRLASINNYDDTEIREEISNKVDKIEGYSLVADSEIEKLSAITNPIKIKGRVDTIDDFPSDASTGDLYFVGAEGSEDYKEYVLTEDNTWEQIGVSKVDLSNYVLKEEGYSLVADSEITRLASVDNYDDTDIQTNITALQEAIDANNEAEVGKKYYADGVAKGEIFNTYETINDGMNFIYRQANEATGNYSHSEGLSTIASGKGSHAEGVSVLKDTTTRPNANSYNYVTASGEGSHAEGGATTASGNYSHAEGINTTASGIGSHAEGENTIAASNYQHVSGKYNIEDTPDENGNGKYIFILGNGVSTTLSTNRSNALAIDWDGNIYQNNEETGHNLTTMQTSIDNKVDKVEGYSLVADTEIAKLTNMETITIDDIDEICV